MAPIVWILIALSALLGGCEWWLARRQTIGRWLSRVLIGCDVIVIVVLLLFAH